MTLGNYHLVDEIRFEDYGDTCVLVMEDVWAWNSTDERYTYVVEDREVVVVHDFVHMVYILDKTLSYQNSIIRQYLAEECDIIIDRYMVRLVSVFPLNERAEWFLGFYRYFCKREGIELECTFSEDDDYHRAVRRDTEAAKADRQTRLAGGTSAGATPAGMENDEMLQGDVVWKEEIPPCLRRSWNLDPQRNPDKSWGDEDEVITPEDAGTVFVHARASRIEITIVDETDWGENDSLDPSDFESWTDEMVAEHDLLHMLQLWDTVRRCLNAWMSDELEIEKEFQGDPIAFRLVATFPPSDRGKWFLDWLRLFVDLFGHGFEFELSATEEAHNLRMAAVREAAGQAKG